MSDLQFDTPDNEFGRPPEAKPGFDITGKLVEWGLVSSRQEAQYVLIGVGVLALIAAFFFMRSGGSSAPVLLS
ncbi:hypothetical protein HY970_01325 [Candidatus Kaiserbacteria bacterium]|nr:hypothetical protein [Candidatus Kaiserbacteria bacterium]